MPGDEAKPMLPRSEASCLSITIVGVLGDDVPDHARLVTIGEAILREVTALFPGFVPGYPPFVVAFTALPELRIHDG